MKGIALILVAGLVAALAVEVHVTLNVFSGGEDPSWTVSGPEALRLLSLFPGDIYTAPPSPRPIPWYRLGYRGFEVRVSEHDVVRRFVVYNNAALEMALLLSSNDTLQDTVMSHVRDETVRLATLTETGDLSEEDMYPPRDLMPDGPCDLPIRGPDNVTTYAPQTENCGYFTSHCSQNNCYNYGNDIVTDTFAQPGRGSGQKWSSNTCDDIRASATRDGLVWAGTTLPQVNPPIGHYVALLIWPNTNFHWVRLDSLPAGGWWSHKPGGTPVRNTDNNNKKISDPSKQDFSPWSQFCGYMTTIPSKARIN